MAQTNLASVLIDRGDFAAAEAPLSRRRRRRSAVSVRGCFARLLPSASMLVGRARCAACARRARHRAGRERAGQCFRRAVGPDVGGQSAARRAPLGAKPRPARACRRARAALARFGRCGWVTSRPTFAPMPLRSWRPKYGSATIARDSRPVRIRSRRRKTRRSVTASPPRSPASSIAAPRPPDDTAQRIRDDGIDILIDLNGYTTHARSEIFALRPAPVQINWLGYLGTLGAPWYDYVITDRFATPDDQQAFFTERFLAMPHCCAPSDTRRVAAAVPSREACGLPAQGFVFACFNAPYKILPPVFDVWMRLLARCSGQHALARAARPGTRPSAAGSGRSRHRPGAADIRRAVAAGSASGAPCARRSLPRHASLQCGHDGERCAVHGGSGADLQRRDDGLAHRRQPVACDRTAGAGDGEPGRVRSARLAPGPRAGKPWPPCAPGSPPTATPTRCSTWPAIRKTSKPCSCTPGMSAIASEPPRNAPCPCGSGKRYKDCHGAIQPPLAPAAWPRCWPRRAARLAQGDTGQAEAAWRASPRRRSGRGRSLVPSGQSGARARPSRPRRRPLPARAVACSRPCRRAQQPGAHLRSARRTPVRPRPAIARCSPPPPTIPMRWPTSPTSSSDAKTSPPPPKATRARWPAAATSRPASGRSARIALHAIGAHGRRRTEPARSLPTRAGHTRARSMSTSARCAFDKASSTRRRPRSSAHWSSIPVIAMRCTMLRHSAPASAAPGMVWTIALPRCAGSSNAKRPPGASDAAVPFPLLAMPLPPRAVVARGERMVGAAGARRAVPRPTLAPEPRRTPAPGLRLGGFSRPSDDALADRLLGAARPRSRIETFAYSLLPAEQSALGARVGRAFDHFADVERGDAP